jgi:methylglutaconyl-CoA hydratase
MEGNVNYNIEHGIATITFYHPQSNSLPGKVLKQLADTIQLLGENESARVIVLKSEGARAFCAGASFDELMAIEKKEQGKTFFMGFANVINAMRKCPKFIIGRVQGKAVGGGVGLAASVDYCLATKYAAIKLSELAIGIGPFVVGPAVQRKLGISGMSHLAINATEWKSAEWAEANGLYQDVFENSDELDKAVYILAEKLANSNPEAMRELKQTFWKGCEDWGKILAERASISGVLVLSDFTRNAISKFKKK